MTLSRAGSSFVRNGRFWVIRMDILPVISILSTPMENIREHTNRRERKNACRQRNGGKGLESRIRRMLVGDRVVGMSPQAKLNHLDLQGEMFAACREQGVSFGRPCGVVAGGNATHLKQRAWNKFPDMSQKCGTPLYRHTPGISPCLSAPQTCPRRSATSLLMIRRTVSRCEV